MEEDFTGDEDGGAGARGSLARLTAPYDPAKDREQLRGWLAMALVGLFAVAVLVIVGSAVVLVRPFDQEAVAVLLTGVLSPLAALVGAALGFYFGRSY